MRALLAAGSLGLATIAALSWGATTLFVDPAYDAVVEANGRFAAGDFRGALARYRLLQHDRPDLAQLAVNAGNALYRLQEYPRALADYDHALDQATREIRAIASYNRGNALFRLGRLEDARVSYVDALRANPADRDAKYNVEVIDRMLQEMRLDRRNPSGQQDQPGQSGRGAPGGQQQPGQPGASQRPGQQPGQQPGQPGQDSQGGPGASPTPGVGAALLDFRRNLTVEEALRLLDALRGEQRGVETYVEGQQPRRGTDPKY